MGVFAAGAVVVGGALTLAGAAMQTPPDLSGRWTAVAAAPAAGERGATSAATIGSGWGTDFTITQSAAALVVDRAQFSQYDMQPPMRFRYALDGSESRHTIDMGRGPQELVSKAAWRGATLVITTTFRFTDPQTGKPATSDVTHVLALDSSGALVIATTRSGAAGAAPSTSSTSYHKMERQV